MIRSNEGPARSCVRPILVACVLAVVLVNAAAANEPSLLIYPNKATVFRYDPARYDIVYPGDDNFEQPFSIAGQMLWDKWEKRVPQEIYRAPQIIGFAPSTSAGSSEFVSQINELVVSVDGHSVEPRLLPNLYVRFIPRVPEVPLIRVNGAVIDGLIHPIGDLVVHTPDGEGFYSDILPLHIAWSGTTRMRISVFADKDGNGVQDGPGPLYTVVVEDNTVPVRESTWGAVKARFTK